MMQLALSVDRLMGAANFRVTMTEMLTREQSTSGERVNSNRPQREVEKQSDPEGSCKDKIGMNRRWKKSERGCGMKRTWSSVPAD